PGATVLRQAVRPRLARIDDLGQEQPAAGAAGGRGGTDAAKIPGGGRAADGGAALSVGTAYPDAQIGKCHSAHLSRPAPTQVRRWASASLRTSVSPTCWKVGQTSGLSPRPLTSSRTAPPAPSAGRRETCRPSPRPSPRPPARPRC